MSTISTRIDENIKAEAEEIADGIGITLSAAISIFIKKFVSCNGFPFEVSAPVKKVTIINETELDSAVKSAVLDSGNTGHPDCFTYLDPKTNKMITISRNKEQ